MKKETYKKKLLRIFIDNQDKHNGEPLWEAILKSVKEHKLAGATVFKGVAGIGTHSEFRAFNVWRLKQELPIVLEIIDDEDKIKEFAEFLGNIIKEGLITIQDIDVIAYKHR